MEADDEISSCAEVLAHCGDPVVVLAVEDHRIRWANFAFQSEVSHGNVYVNRSFTQNFIHPDDIPVVASLLATFRSSTTQQPESTQLKPIRARFQILRLSDGLPKYATYDWTISQHPASRSLILVGRSIDNELEVRDISKAAEFEDFFENAPIALHWLSGEGIVLWANRTELDFLGYTKDEYFGQNIMNFCPDEPVVLEIFKQLGSGNTIHDVPVRMRHKDGTIKDVVIDSNVNYHPDGSFHHTRCFIRDDTKRKTEEARLKAQIEAAEAAMSAKDDFLHAFAHDLRTPMQALLGTVQLLSMTPLDADQQGYVETILSSGNELCHMLDNIMDSVKSRHDGGQVLPMKSEVFDLKAEIESVIKRLAVLLQDKDVLLSLAWHSGIASRVPQWVRGDPSSVKRVLINLISNSLRFTEKGFITVSVKYDKADPQAMPFRISVVDTGPGVTKEDAPHVFEKYWKGELRPGKGNTGAEAALGTGGCGLGLSICTMLVKAMGGVIGVQPADPENGVTGGHFWFKLPLMAVSEQRPGPVSNAGSEVRSLEYSRAFSETKLPAPSQPQSCVEQWVETVVTSEPVPPTIARSDRAPSVSVDSATHGIAGMDLGDPANQNAAIEAIMRQSQAAIESIRLNGMGRSNTGPVLPYYPQYRQNDIDTPTFSATPMHHYSQSYGRAVEEENRNGMFRSLAAPFYPTHHPSGEYPDSLGTVDPRSLPYHHTGPEAAHMLKPVYQRYAPAAPPSQQVLRPATSTSSGSASASELSYDSSTPFEPSFSRPVSKGVQFEPLNLRILVAEDNALCQKVAKQILRRLNCRVDVAVDGVEVLNLYSSRGSNTWDAILMDIRMPNMDGITCARHLREDLKCDIPILAVTAERGDVERRKCFMVGMNAFLSKPIMIGELVAKLRDLCGSGSSSGRTG
ncbi:hypothetical protein BC832DRAFT_541559 [Gaertneriomyces semiglobifer]|nr:hypothetical protein BC832DRAFT_541559 [Gaertneriomyces semiglobifer]